MGWVNGWLSKSHHINHFREMACPAGLEPAPSCLEDVYHKTLSATSGESHVRDRAQGNAEAITGVTPFAIANQCALGNQVC